MENLSEAYLAALVSLGMAVAFFAADPKTPTSRALALALVGAAGSIYCNTTFIYGRPIEQLPSFAGWLVLPEVIGFIAAYQWLYHVRQTIPATNLRTRAGDNLVRSAQVLVLVYGATSFVWPGLRAEYFQNALGSPGAVHEIKFYLFAAPLELSILMVTWSTLLLLKRKPDIAERRRLVAICIAVPLMASGLVIDNKIAPMVTVIGEMILLIGAVQYHVFQGQRNQFLRRFLSPPVEDLVRKQGLSRAMQEDTRTISVVACDLRGFTALAGTQQSDQTLQLLREFYDAIGQVTTEFGATIKDYAGDGVLILVGAPLPCSDAPQRAARLARAVHGAVKPILRHWSSGSSQLGLGVGIATGPVTVGVIGGARLEYVAVGQTVNLAARLCDHAGAGEVLIDDTTARSIGTDLATEARGDANFKGFDEQVGHFAVT